MDEGHFFDPLAKEVQEDFMPWLMDQVTDNLDQIVMSRTLADTIITSAMELSVEKQNAAKMKKEAELKAKREEEERRRREEEEARLAAEAAKAEQQQEEEGE